MLERELSGDHAFWSAAGREAVAAASALDVRAVRWLRLLASDRHNAAEVVRLLTTLLQRVVTSVSRDELEALTAFDDPEQYLYDLDGSSPSGGRIDGEEVVDAQAVRDLVRAELERRGG
ncbi:MAG: hypothetical protein JNJ54_31295 [Myxococcaceae bacterium]|nr:hypothetical protein [Myxococcaceae bacterium]